MRIADYVYNKKILIWGYGKEGKSMHRFLSEKAQLRECTVYEGRQSGIDEAAYDLIIKSPGIVAERYNEKYTSMTELFLMEFSGQVIGITGTKGKVPCLDCYDEIDEHTIIVFEMSCHQLQYLKISPHIAVFLNFYPEHLDHYGTVENYYLAKKKITSGQTEKDYLFVGEQLRELESRAVKQVIPYEAPDTYELQLPGKHNQFNARVVYTICTEIFGCDGERVRERMKGFSPLRHRLENIGTFDGIDYYDDSISTIPESTIEAIKSVSNAKTILIGGMDRGISYVGLIDFIRKHPEYHYIFMYASGKRIYEELSDEASCRYCEDLQQAVANAKKITKAGEACILSPAAASYGYFKNFEERGDVFRQMATGRM